MLYEEYDKMPGLRHGDLVNAVINPAKFAAKKSGEIETPEATARMQFGLMVDDYLTRGIKPAMPDFQLIPPEVLSKSGSRSGKAWQEYRKYMDDAQATFMTQREVDKAALDLEDKLRSLEMIVDNIRNHSIAYRLLMSRSIKRYTQFGVRFSFGPVQCKTLIDVVVPDIAIVDIKCTGVSLGRPWWNLVDSYGYDVQMLFHRMGWQQFCDTTATPTKERMPCYWVVIDVAPPHTVDVVGVPSEAFEVAEEWCRATIPWVARCNQENDWRRKSQKTVLYPELPPYWRASRMEKVRYL